MAKYKRTNVGSLSVAKEKGKPDYIYVAQDVVLKKGSYLNLESEKYQRENIKFLRDNDKLPPDVIDEMEAKIDKVQWYRVLEKDANGKPIRTEGHVKYQIVRLEKQSE